MVLRELIWKIKSLELRYCPGRYFMMLMCYWKIGATQKIFLVLRNTFKILFFCFHRNWSSITVLEVIKPGNWPNPVSQLDRNPLSPHSMLIWFLGGSFVCTPVHALKSTYNQSFELFLTLETLNRNNCKALLLRSIKLFSEMDNFYYFIRQFILSVPVPFSPIFSN